MTAFLYQRSLIAGVGRVTLAPRAGRPRRARPTRSTSCSTRTAGTARVEYRRAEPPRASARAAACPPARRAPASDPAARRRSEGISWHGPHLYEVQASGVPVERVARRAGGCRDFAGASADPIVRGLLERTRADPSGPGRPAP